MSAIPRYGALRSITALRAGPGASLVPVAGRPSGPVTVLPNAFGDFGEGLLNVSRVKTGRVTLARLTHSGDRYSLHLATGEAKTPGLWEEAGWAPPAPQLPSLEITLDEPIEGFIQQVLSQHYIISYGDNTEPLRDLCSILGVAVM